MQNEKPKYVLDPIEAANAIGQGYQIKIQEVRKQREAMCGDNHPFFFEGGEVGLQA